MKLEQQVCSLELAKKLKELGMKQESHFYWNCLNQKPRLATHKTLALYEGDRLSLVLKVNDIYSAFTVAELGEMLPEFYKVGRAVFRLKLPTKCNEAWIYTVPIVTETDDFDLDPTFGKTEADARAKTLIYLIENNLYEPTR